MQESHLVVVTSAPPADQLQHLESRRERLDALRSFYDEQKAPVRRRLEEERDVAVRDLTSTGHLIVEAPSDRWPDLLGPGGALEGLEIAPDTQFHTLQS